MKNKLKNKIKDKYKELKVYIKQILLAKASYELPFFKRIYMKIKGFTPDQYVLYNLKENNIDNYISEMERWKSREINGKYKLIMDDKLLFPEMFGKYVNVPKNLAWIRNKKIHNFTGNYFTNREFIDLIYKQGKIILKPNYGGGGRGIYIVQKTNKGLLYNNKLISKDKLLEKIKRLDDYIVCEFINQHRYSNEIFDKSINTIRILTIINPESGGVSIVDAVHRIGNKESIPVDNASRGALVAKVDLDSGRLGVARNYFSEQVHKNHPDSNSRIKGVKIPFWNNIKKSVIDAARNFPYVYYMAWDIVVTEEGFYVIEVNASTGLDLVQMWEGKRNNQLGEFFKYHGIIS